MLVKCVSFGDGSSIVGCFLIGFCGGVGCGSINIYNYIDDRYDLGVCCSGF